MRLLLILPSVTPRLHKGSMDTKQKQALILGLGKKLEAPSRREGEKRGSSDLDEIADDLIDSMRSGDRDGVVDTLRAAYMAIRMEGDL